MLIFNAIHWEPTRKGISVTRVTSSLLTVEVANGLSSRFLDQITQGYYLSEKMAFSKPTHIIYNLVGAYFESLYENPLKTKAITSCVIATLGNLASQRLSGVKYLNQDSLIAFGLFGLLFGGTIPHYFYKYVQSITRNPLGILLIERLIYTPCFQALSLYLLTRFEGYSDEVARKQLQKLYWPILTANLKYLTLLQFINIKFVPPMLQVLVVNLIGFLWVIFLANKRAKVERSTRG